MSSVRRYPEAIRDYLASECMCTRANRWPTPRRILPGTPHQQVRPDPEENPGGVEADCGPLSSPEGASVNDGVYEHLCSLKYVSVDDAVGIITRLGRGSLMAKVDVRKAYRIIPVCPADRLLYGKMTSSSTPLCRSVSGLPRRFSQR